MANKDNYYDWDDSVYGTGPTEPPKSRGGILALLLILIIFLCGVVTVLGVLNIRMFQQLKRRENTDLTISFTTEQTEPTEAVEAAIQSVPEEAPIPYASMDLAPAPAGVDNTPAEGGMSLQDIYTRNIPSVVSITSKGYHSSSTGTGVVLSDDGYIVTNAHVVDGAAAITVQLTDERTFEADLVGRDEVSDLAVLYVETEDLTPAQFGDSSVLRVGDTVVAIGDPLGVKFRGTYTDGIVSAINRDVDVDGRSMTLIQTNAALNAGNSGGPLINCYGQVVGINTMKIGDFASSAGVEGLGFAIPSVTVKQIVDQIISQGYVSGRPSLGLTGEAVLPFYQYYNQMPAGLLITWVDPNSDAAQKGIVDGDVLISIDGLQVTSMDQVKSALYDHEAGQTVQAVIYRNRQQYLVDLVLSEDKG